MSIEKRICFVIPYFGTLPNYFPVFLKSCEINVNYDWLLLTDDHTHFNYPENVKACYMTFDQLKRRIEQLFSFPISLATPKKLCDFKPAYGYIFENELKSYPYWGNCDIDLVLGDLDRFLDMQKLQEYQKHFYLGHMTVYENSPEIRELFMKGNPKKENNDMKFGFQDVFGCERNMSFDEWSNVVETINEIAEKENICINPDFPMLDIRPWRSKFNSTVFDPHTHSWINSTKDNNIVVWERGRLYAYSKETNGKLRKKEILYAHFQKRKMHTKNIDLDADTFLFYPNVIESCKEISDKTIKHKMKLASLRSLLHIDERSKQKEELSFLWKHRFNKYIKNKIITSSK
ncbi:MAG: hypothetical protein IKF18_02095 [Erysipelotrichaceae bacterium]|nr:hypothetical protein [Erysipelotrichaceae bacterium]